ncbi:MAG: DUF423 domain-containing protein [Bacteroidia bacterium]|nr:DUF423 domain-containing protein [Bacteroidia bacterium]
MTIGISGALAVALGALGAHFLKDKMQAGLISANALAGFETAVKYHLFHTLAMLMVLMMMKDNNTKLLTRAYRFFLWGILLFSGSLYLLCTRELFHANWLKVLGPITPIGGVLMILGWLSLAWAGIKKSN